MLVFVAEKDLKGSPYAQSLPNHRAEEYEMNLQMLTREDTRTQAGKYCNRQMQLWLQTSVEAFQWKETKRDYFE